MTTRSFSGTRALSHRQKRAELRAMARATRPLAAAAECGDPVLEPTQAGFLDPRRVKASTVVRDLDHQLPGLGMKTDSYAAGRSVFQDVREPFGDEEIGRAFQLDWKS